MSKKSMINAAISAVLLIIFIILAVLLCGMLSALPVGAKQFKGIVNGCNKRSSSAVQGNYGRSSLYSAPSLVGCETVDDYMKACGLRFGYMSEEGNVTQKVYFVSASENSEFEEGWFDQSEFGVILTVVGADYVDSEGEAHTVYEIFSVICSKNGGILSVL